MARYIKYNKAVGEQLKNDLISVETELRDLFNAIQSYCTSKRALSADQVYRNTNLWEDMGEGISRFFTGDYNNAYNSFRSNLLDVYNKTTEKENGELSNLTSLKNSVIYLDQIINEFDVATAFNLKDSYKSDNSISFGSGSDGTTVIYYLDEDGKEVSLQELTNAFYTYTGMSMDSQMKGYLTAQENGVDFDENYQKNIQLAVNANIGDIQAAGGFRVASEQDIIGVDEYLKEDINYKSYLAYDAEGKLARDTGATNANNMAVGSDALSKYTMTDYINGNKFSDGNDFGNANLSASYDVPGSGGSGSYSGSDDGGGSAGSRVTKPYPDPDAGTDNATTDNTTPEDSTSEDTIPEDTNPEDTTPDDGTTPPPEDTSGDYVGETGLTQDEVDDMSREIDTISGDEDYENVKVDTIDDYDAMARDKFETMNPAELGERRGKITAEAEELFANEDKTALINRLKEYGYDERDIDKIIQSEDATISAMMEGDQRMTMSEYAKEFAEKDGVKDFDSKYDDKQEYRNYDEDSSSHIIANRNSDEKVKEKREDYVNSKTEYEKAGEEVNRSIDKVNDSKDEIEKFKEEHGSDVSKWSKEEVKEYKDKVEQYNKDIEDMNKNKEELSIKEKAYNEDKAEYEKAKDDFDKRIRGENVEDTQNLNDREQEESGMDVTVNTDDLLPANEVVVEESTEIKYYGGEPAKLGPTDGTGAPNEGMILEHSSEARPDLGPTDGTGAPNEGMVLEHSSEAMPKLAETEIVISEEAPIVAEDGTVLTNEPPIVKEDGTVGVEVTDTSNSESFVMNQNDLLNLATETSDVSQLGNNEVVTSVAETPVSVEPTFSAEAAVEPSFNMPKEEIQNATKSLEGETAQDIEKEIIDNLVVTDDSLSFAKPSNGAAVADTVTNVGNGQTEISVGEAALLSQITQNEIESKKEE